MGIMNHHAMLLDCTLRDGAYLVDKNLAKIIYMVLSKA